MNQRSDRFWPIVILVLLCGPLVVTAGILIWHATYIGFFAPRETLQFYQFGSEVMGWRHSSRMVYFLSGVGEGVLILGAIWLFARWLLRRPEGASEDSASEAR